MRLIGILRKFPMSAPLTQQVPELVEGLFELMKPLCGIGDLARVFLHLVAQLMFSIDHFTNAREDVNISTQATVASKLKKQSPPELIIDDVAIVEGPITPAMARTLIFDAHASVRTAGIPNTRSQSAFSRSACADFPMRDAPVYGGDPGKRRCCW